MCSLLSRVGSIITDSGSAAAGAASPAKAAASTGGTSAAAAAEPAAAPVSYLRDVHHPTVAVTTWFGDMIVNAWKSWRQDTKCL